MKNPQAQQRKILKVIHGYPPYYMAGSEVYSFNLCNELKKDNSVFVFTRIENPYAPPYAVSESNEGDIHILRVNKPTRDYTFKDKYLDTKIDKIFRDYLERVSPGVVHIGHISHLSTGILNVIKEKGIPIVFTVHDFWMGCFRGQYIKPDMSVCEGKSTENCLNCARYFFKDWMSVEEITTYEDHMKHVLAHVDHFLIPSQTLMSFYREMGVPGEKLVFSPYGFDKNRISVKKVKQMIPDKINFGFIGRVIPVKGVHLMLKTFKRTKGEAQLFLYGALGSDAKFLRQIKGKDKRIHFMGGFDNTDIEKVLHSIDILIVPSIWLENAPLVIQEAFLAGVPVITSNTGGMGELVKHQENGLTFPIANEDALYKVLQSVINSPEQIAQLTPDPASVRSIADDASFCNHIYQRVSN